MDTSKLKKFAQFARRALLEQVDAKLDAVLADSSPARRESADAVKQLEAEVERRGRIQVVEQVAYTWFNRFCALRYMDVNGYTRVGIVSPTKEFTQPEILTEAKQGQIDEDLKVDREAIRELLNGTRPSRDPQQEVYRMLLVAACNFYNSLMPFMFEEIADYTELLMPDDLLSGNSVLTYTREALLPENCSPEHTEQSVEVIGWLYQFYISEKKDDVFAALKKGKKITPENIPAATQLFTPHWIVRYLVENSLGRLWMLNHPQSKLIDRMDYYIKPEEPETDFLRISSPEEIKVCDPACGSGHMLTYAFDLLHAIYEEQGYQATEIPTLILTHNLFGIEIDQRAGALAAFALTMKAREKDRRFFTRKRTTADDSPAASRSQLTAGPNICVLENIHFKADELDDYIEQAGVNLFTSGPRGVLTQWEEADNFGSLIRPLVTDVSEVLEILRERQMGSDLFLADVHQKVLKALRQADYLSPKYHVVVANPPYMGSRGMNPRLTTWTKKTYPNSRADFFSMFMERGISCLLERGYMGMINLPSWLFLSTFSALRELLLAKTTMLSMLHMGRGIFGIDWGSVAFVLQKAHQAKATGDYFRLHERNFQHIYYEDIKTIFLNARSNSGYRYDFRQYRDEAGRNEIPRESNDSGQLIRYKACALDLKNIPGTPFAYWVSESIRSAFKKHPALSERARPRQGNTTTDNARFVRSWFEVPICRIGFQAASADEFNAKGTKWCPYNKGGGSRRWYGLNESIVDWEDHGRRIKSIPHSVVANESLYFRPGITWSTIKTGASGFRSFGHGFIFDNKGACLYSEEQDREFLCSLLNSIAFVKVLGEINPSIAMQPGDVGRMPVINAGDRRDRINSIATCAVALTRADWDESETSWDFSRSPLASYYKDAFLKEQICQVMADLKKRVIDLTALEVENNSIFIELYDLEAETSAEVALESVTLNCNPYYRYGSDKGESELEALLVADTMREFISYAVGCMLGRYSLDAPGLILANQGDTVEDYRRIIGEKQAASGDTRENLSFEPDEDNVIPILDGDWFPDDITERFKKFLKVTFGEEHFDENMRFLEESLGKDVCKYFLTDFYKNHVQTYKKRPIYWLFSSPKGTFNALIYMHRYRPDTVSVVLKYLRDFQTKLQAHKQHLQSIADSADAKKADKTKALKEITQLTKDLKELEDYERKVIYPLASERREIDLDDGVKHNYPLFGEALKKIPGLDAKEDE